MAYPCGSSLIPPTPPPGASNPSPPSQTLPRPPTAWVLPHLLSSGQASFLGTSELPSCLTISPSELRLPSPAFTCPEASPAGSSPKVCWLNKR